MLSVILAIIGNQPRNQSFYSGSYLFTIIPSFLLVRLMRSLFYFRLRVNPELLEKRDQYFKARIISFFIQLIIALVDLLIYTLDLL